MQLDNNIILIEPFACVYLKDVDSLVLADLHLGYEGILAEQGTLLPKVQFKIIMREMERVVEKQKATRVIINGDLKHEFSETSYHEFKEIDEFLAWLQKRFELIDLIKGNHDTYIYRVAKRHGAKVSESLRVGRYLITHGHKPLEISGVTIIAHEHPALGLFTELGIRERLKCFLWYAKKKILVLPAMSYFAYGTEVNLVPRDALLSPLLRKLGVEEFKPIGILEHEKYLEFPRIKSINQTLYQD